MIYVMNLANPAPENDVVRLDPMSPEHKDMLLKSELSESMWRWMPVMSTGTSLEAYQVSRTHRRLEIGIVWHPEKYRGTAIVPATQLALLTKAHEARFRRISYFIPEQNERAIRAFSRIGAQKEGLIRNYMRTAGGTWTNMVVLGLVGDEIRAAISVLRDRVRALQLA